MNRKIMMILVLLVVTGFVLAGCSKKSTLQENANALSGEEMKVDLPPDTDDGDVQVRHLSWGKFNYYPQEIHVLSEKKVRIVGDTTRLLGCFRSLTIPDLKVQGQFTETNNAIEFTPSKAGTYGFGCEMGMGSGKLIVQ